jgi:5-hydroxyisourate hydrolase
MRAASFVTTHVLDSALGVPAQGVAVVLAAHDGDGWTEVATGTTDTDGRISTLGPASLPSGTYRLTFAVGDYFAAQGTAAFYPEVSVTCRIESEQAHYHVPLLLSPFAYSTYRGS